MFAFSRKINSVKYLGYSVLNNVTYKNKNRFEYQLRSLKKQSSCPSISNPTVLELNNIAREDVKEVIEDSTLESFNYDAITKGDKELEHKLKVLMLEAEVLRQQGFLVPPNDAINNEMWEYILTLETRTARRRYFSHIFKTHKTKENRKLKQLNKQKEFQEFRLSNPLEGQKSLSIEEHAMKYELKHNNLFLRIYDSTMNHFYNNRLVKAMQFGQKLVIDCGFEQNMTKKENQYCAKQLMLLFAENRLNDDPFDVFYTNLEKQGDLGRAFHKFIPTMYDLDFPINIHHSSYLDLFPKEKLIYLTPHCREQMETFDNDAIYIIGGIVDKVNNEPLSLAKAKREGIKMLKFPLDKYLFWGAGSGKSLTLNQCVSILLDLKSTGDWQHALRHVPKRKLMDTKIIQSSKATSRFDIKRQWKPT